MMLVTRTGELKTLTPSPVDYLDGLPKCTTPKIQFQVSTNDREQRHG